MEPRARLIDATTLLLCCLSALLAALLEVLLVPLYVGATLVPLTLGLAALSNIVLPLLARRTIRSTGAAAAPVLLWALAVILLAQSPSGGDVLLPGGGGVGYVSYGVLGIGAAAGILTVFVTMLRDARRGPAAQLEDDPDVVAGVSR